MEPTGGGTFNTSGDAYDGFMGRYSRVLAAPFAAWVGVRPGDRALDVGCGPGALTAELVDLLGEGNVVAVDPSPSFVDACRARHPGVDVRLGRAEQLPVDDDSADVAMSQLVMHFVGDPGAAAAELARAVRPGGRVASCVWDFADGMQMLRAYWDAATALDANAPDEAKTLRFGGPGEIADLFAEAGFTEVAETTLTVSADYTSFDELWAGFLAGVGPAGAHCIGLSEADRETVRRTLYARVGSPSGAFSLSASARAASAVVG